ncbi:Transcriptional regulator ovo [Taenia solium]|eukprot:TsM_000330000 transcript=TsM_000330000 gene=TsM_000330000
MGVPLLVASQLVKQSSKERAEGGYQCLTNGQWRRLLQDVDKHLRCHSDSKFYLCVRYLMGCNETVDVKRHTRKHTVCALCSRRFTQHYLLEGHQSSVHQMTCGHEQNQSHEEFRVCESFGFVC